MKIERIIIEIKDNPQGINLDAAINEIKNKMLDLGVFVNIIKEKSSN